MGSRRDKPLTRLRDAAKSRQIDFPTIGESYLLDLVDSLQALASCRYLLFRIPRNNHSYWFIRRFRVSFKSLRGTTRFYRARQRALLWVLYKSAPSGTPKIRSSGAFMQKERPGDFACNSKCTIDLADGRLCRSVWSTRLRLALPTVLNVRAKSMSLFGRCC